MPRMSNSPAPPSNQPPPEQGAPPPEQPPVLNYGPPPLPKMEAWFSIFVGLILLFGFPRFFNYLFDMKHYDQDNPITDASGNQIPYLHSDFLL
ncbi:MAG TPA: hypothetical protein VMD30_02795, partial [Tepidisphaeraceae bacterium]|nr:hypothetical protein [Tepidisphaeraceae bacterium]